MRSSSVALRGSVTRRQSSVRRTKSASRQARSAGVAAGSAANADSASAPRPARTSSAARATRPSTVGAPCRHVSASTRWAVMRERVGLTSYEIPAASRKARAARTSAADSCAAGSCGRAVSIADTRWFSVSRMPRVGSVRATRELSAPLPASGVAAARPIRSAARRATGTYSPGPQMKAMGRSTVASGVPLVVIVMRMGERPGASVAFACAIASPGAGGRRWRA